MLTVLFVLSVLIEISVYSLPTVWRHRKIMSVILLLLVGSISVAILITQINPAGLFVFITGFFRVINLLRIVENRMHAAYLQQVTKRSGWLFIAAQTVGIFSIGLFSHKLVSSGTLWLLTGMLQASTASLILVITSFNVYKTKHRSLLERYSDQQLPTITVAIPARNETRDLEECLRSILANDYPKLEILVLDDCSQDRTPEIIRSFAQEGVRFLPGTEPTSRWLAKNQAYANLAKEANGKYIVYCGVDVRFGPDALRALVTTALNTQKLMLSILPLRTRASIMNAFIQPVRYWWELALPRFFTNRPPVLSTCWLIDRQKLNSLGGFGAACHSIIPEAVLARALAKTNEYSFVRSDNVLDIQTHKRPDDQLDTALRTLYPQIRRRPEMALMLSLIDIVLLLAPFVFFIAGFFINLGLAHWLAGLAALLLTLTHLLIVRVSDPSNTIVALVNFPLAVLLEMVIGLSSMWMYEFSTVKWKGRNVCIPVMHVVDHLPKDKQAN